MTEVCINIIFLVAAYCAKFGYNQKIIIEIYILNYLVSSSGMHEIYVTH